MERANGESGRQGDGARGREGLGELQIENCKLQIDLIVNPPPIFNFQFAILNLQFSQSRSSSPLPRFH